MRTLLRKVLRPHKVCSFEFCIFSRYEWTMEIKNLVSCIFRIQLNLEHTIRTMYGDVMLRNTVLWFSSNKHW